MADDHDAADDEIKLVQQTLNEISLHSPSALSPSCFDISDVPLVLILDAGYGFPREKKVRKEKINAIASQLANFLIWQQLHRQQQQQGRHHKHIYNHGIVQVVGCPDENIKFLLESRTIENMKRVSPSTNALPPNVTLSCERLEQHLDGSILQNYPQHQEQFNQIQDDDQNIGNNVITSIRNISNPVYLSPDADRELSPHHDVPKVVIIGLLIDRRVQPNRSKHRANNIGVISRRLPLSSCFKNIDASEPLNVDCVLELIQQWSWNWDNCRITNDNDTVETNSGNNAFMKAASQAIEHHVNRHPSRPIHVTKL